MDYIIVPVRMAGKLAEKFHVRNSWLVGRRAVFLERREPQEQLTYHFFVSFFRENIVHIQILFVHSTKILIFTIRKFI